MKITVAYLGGARSQTGCKTEELEVPEGATVADVRGIIAGNYPALAPHLDTVRYARNFEFTTLDTTLEAGDELGLIPPVQGGAPRTSLTTDPIEPAALLEQVADRGVGATVLFVGTVRDASRGKEVARLDYEAYVPMVERQLEEIATQCESGHEGVTMAIAHRHGKLAIGDVSIAIAAASPHRDTAFDACRQAIETIKKDVAIWKKEHTTDGEEWVGWGGG